MEYQNSGLSGTLIFSYPDDEKNFNHLNHESRFASEEPESKLVIADNYVTELTRWEIID